MSSKRSTHGGAHGFRALETQRTTRAAPGDNRAAPCPDCGADVGELCTGLSQPSSVHHVRKRLSARVRNQQMDFEGLLFAQKSSTDLRQRVIRYIDVPTIAKTLGINPATMRTWLNGGRPTGEAGALFGRLMMKIIADDTPLSRTSHANDKTPLRELDGK